VKLAKYVTFSEYVDHASQTWKDYPTAMICEAAESVLCKQFANVTGIVAEETMRKDGSVIDSSPTACDARSTIADDLVAKIEACATAAEFDVLRETIAGAAGKLFGTEKDRVFTAAKKKRTEMEAVAVQPTPVQDAEPGASAIAQRSHSDATGGVRRAARSPEGPRHARRTEGPLDRRDRPEAEGRGRRAPGWLRRGGAGTGGASASWPRFLG
jgi:hypothetical protein